MIFTAKSRELLLDELPKGCEIAEIGVAKGVFSGEIMRRCSPKKLHLIDPWKHMSGPGYKDYNLDVNNTSDAEGNNRIKMVMRRFGREIRSGSIEIHRMTSKDGAYKLSNKKFGWIYLDACHLEEHVFEDLSLWSALIREDGYIVGHDYVKNDLFGMEFGVIEAVARFLDKYPQWEMVHKTEDRFPSYILHKKPIDPEDIVKRANLPSIYHRGMPTVILGDAPCLEDDLPKLNHLGKIIICAHRSCLKFRGYVHYVCSIHHWNPEWVWEWRDKRRRDGLNYDFQAVHQVQTEQTNICVGTEMVEGCTFNLGDTGLLSTMFALKLLEPSELWFAGFDMSNKRHKGYLESWRLMYRENFYGIREKARFVNAGFAKRLTEASKIYINFREDWYSPYPALDKGKVKSKEME